MAAGRGSIATSSRVSCIRLTTDATPTTKPIPSFGSRRPLPRVRTEILRRRPRRNAWAIVGRPSALPDAPSAVVHSLAADRCAALSKASCCGAADRRRPGRARREPGPVRPLVTRSSLRALTKRAGRYPPNLGRNAPREREATSPVIASAAKQSIHTRAEAWIAWLRSQ